MTKEKMLNLKLYECNKKRCGDKCSNLTTGCHLTHEDEYAVDPKQVLGYEALIRDSLDDYWRISREQYLDAIVKANYYPGGAQTAAGIVGVMLDTDVQKNLKTLQDKMREYNEKSNKSGNDSSDGS